MNVNLSSLTESSTTPKTNLTDATESSETSESKGFFSKLSSLILGGGQNVKSEKGVDIESPDNELLLQTQNLADGEESLDNLLDSDLVDIDESKQVTIASESELKAKESSKTNKIAEQIVADNDEILKRLDSSANVLISKDGKELPVERENPQEIDTVIVSNKVEHNDGARTKALEPSHSVADVTSVALSQETLANSETLKETQVDETVTRDELKWSEEAPQLSKQPLPENKMLVDADNVQQEEILPSDKLINPTQTNVQINTIKEGNEKQISSKGVGERTRVESFDELKGTPIDADMGDDELLASIQTIENSGVKRDELLIKQESLAQHQGLRRLSANTLNQATQHATIAQAHVSQPLPQDLIQESLNTGQQQPMTNTNPAMLSEKALSGTGVTGRAIGNLGKLIEEKQLGSDTNISSVQQAGQGSHQVSASQVSLQRTDSVNSANIQLTRDFAGEQVAEKVQMMMSKNLKNIDIRLDPPELGRLQIRMQVTGEGTSVHFTVSNPQARDAIEHTMPRLREMLAQQGVQLGESSVQQQASGQQRGQYSDKAQGSELGQGSNATLTGDDLETDVGLELNILGKRDGISYYA
ncbi:flagellar hook-length control protein FliK [Vibrio caribbeanicus]|uniref:flagellar hook-length control protein FliK n=1 Tax=Vibrio caribbeanicus TaxID=701175 RepID=UPI0022844FB8|nr:flagellar hook-length control protein FliK [Vibrio caribbeanicus]MCY9845259.1 flagellar hook-length control protein FliK [Vibrio caribbeanicus]